MIISSINEVKIYHSLTYCTKLVNLCLSMLSLPTIEMYAKPSLPGELVYINAKIGKVLRTSYQLSIKQGLTRTPPNITYAYACDCFISLVRRKMVSEKCHSRSQRNYSAFTLAGHVPGAPQWPCALANRDVNKISQTLSQYSNIQVF